MERRKHQRSDISVNLRIETPDMSCPGAARDISSRGIFLDLACADFDDRISDVALHFEIDTGMQVLSRRINGTVVRKEGAGLAVRFSEHDILARAVVHELMYYIQLARQEDGIQTSQDMLEAVHGVSGGYAA